MLCLKIKRLKISTFFGDWSLWSLSCVSLRKIAMFPKRKNGLKLVLISKGILI